jgi:cytochrome c
MKLYATIVSIALLGSASVHAANSDADMQAMAVNKSCMSCHAIDKKLVGPAYKDVAAKYVNDKSALDKLTTKVVKGGGGVWGAMPMPANTQVNEAEAKSLVQWILRQK